MSFITNLAYQISYDNSRRLIKRAHKKYPQIIAKIQSSEYCSPNLKKQENNILGSFTNVVSPEWQECFRDIIDTSQAGKIPVPFFYNRLYELPFVMTTVTKNLSPGARILDAGCGISPLTFLLSKKGYNVNAVDFEYAEGFYGKKSLPEEFAKLNSIVGTTVEFKVGQIESIPYPDATFDAIICVSTIEHTHDPEQIIKEFNRVLKPGGLLIITTDISVSEMTLDVSAMHINAFLSILEKYGSVHQTLPENLSANEIITSKKARSVTKFLMPWKIYLPFGTFLMLPKKFIDLYVVGISAKIK